MLELNFDPFPELQTERLLLRKISMDDASEMLVLRTDINTMRFLDKTKPTSIQEMYDLVSKINDGIKQNNNIGC